MDTPDDAVLVIGGARDPNLAALAAALAACGAPVRSLVVGSEARPALVWDLDRDRLELDGHALRPRAAFLRHDVFDHLADPRPETAHRALAWSTTLAGWLLAHPAVRCFNRADAAGPSNKPHVLVRARAVGLTIPRTLVTNHAGAARALAAAEPTGAIAKPVAGGALTRTLDDALAGADPGPVLAAPALVQERLVAPEVRIFVVGDRTLAFEVRSPRLDYRAGDDVEVVYLGTGPAPVAAQVRALAHGLGLDFAAADLKGRPDGALVFLELNTGPMFARFDQAAAGALTAAMATWLVGGR